MKIKFFLICLFLGFVLLGCDSHRSLRTYVEVVPQQKERALPQDDIHANLGKDALPAQQQTSDPRMQQMLMNSVSQVDLRWQTPTEWAEEKGSGMRLATFRSQEADPITCTIVSLSGAAGGLEANVARWMQQIQIDPAPSVITEALNAGGKVEASAGFVFQIIDLTKAIRDADGQKASLLGAIAQTKEQSIYIKMTGTKNSVLRNKEAFLALVKSIKWEDG